MPWLTLLLVLAALIVLWLWDRAHWQAKFDRRVQELSEQGFPVSLDDIEKAYILPKGVRNAADVYIEAFEYYQKPTEDEERLLPYYKNYTISEYFEGVSQTTMDVMFSFIERNKRTLELLDEASQIQHCLWPKIRDQVWFSNVHYTEIKDAAKLLKVRNLYLAEIREKNALFESLKSSIAIAKTFKIQAFLMDHLVGKALKNFSIESLNESLSRTIFNEHQLTFLQNEFRRLQGLDDLYKALIIDRVCTITFWGLPYKEQGKGSDKPPSPFLKLWNSFSGLIKKDANLTLDYLEEYLKASQSPLHERQSAFYKIDAKRQQLSYVHVFPKRGKNFATVNNIDIRVLGSLRCAETSLAIERYRLKHGSLPESLEQLVPEFMDAVPLEPFDGKVLRYIRHDVGYTVYTIGEDGVDNGGLSREQMKEKTGEDNPKEFDWPFTVRR